MINEIEEKQNLVEAFGEKILTLSGKRSNIVVLTSDNSRDFGLDRFSKSFEDRSFNLGLGINNMISASIGFSIRGKIPFLASFSIFSVCRAIEQIRNSICLPNLNIKIVGFGAGLNMEMHGAGYQVLEDIAMMRSLPNMKVLCPSDYNEVLRAVELMTKDYGPTYLRLPIGFYPSIKGKRDKFEIGKAELLRKGKDICIFTMGNMLYKSLKVADRLEKDGFSTRLVNVSTIKPLDKKMILKSSKKVLNCFSVEEHNVIGGLGSAISEFLSEKNPVRLFRIGMKDCFGETGSKEALYKKFGLDEDGIYKQIRSFL